MNPTRGRIITFYSYKGGVGRSLTLSDVAWILASNGHRVLAIDWDLEAPGLHRYFRPFLADPAGASTPGLIDLLLDRSVIAANAGAGEPSGEGGVSVLPYVQSVDWPFPVPGYLDLMTAGRFDSSYPMRVTTFEWE